MNYSAKNILYINLTAKSYELKSDTDLNKYIGGAGLGLKILASNPDSDPIIFSVGPLNGFFPFASKTSVVLNDGGVVEDLYIGGSASFRIKFSGMDAIAIFGKSKEPVILDIIDEEVSFKPASTDSGSMGLPGKRSILAPYKGKYLVDRYFTTHDYILDRKLVEKNLESVVFTGTKTFPIKNQERYENLFDTLLKRAPDMKVERGSNPSCSGCPMGCEKSMTGEIGGNVLIHSLVSCTYAENIYSDMGIIFSCLNVLGYDYTHEDIENLPKLIDGVLKEFD